ncbi:transglutaminase family protein [Brevibacterium sediminis]|uniref:transglutaminase family protein n=1 Tax=Brevibacterium sediminis TaxID=1857024 RepID=UPI00366CCE59
MSLNTPDTRLRGADSESPANGYSAPSSTGDERPSTGWLEAILVFVAMALTAVAVSAVFKDFAWVSPVLVAVAVVVIVGAVFRTVPALRSTGTAVIAQCVAGLIAVFIVCAGDSLLLGFIPTGESFGTVIDLLSEGVSDLYATAPPAASTPGFIAMLTIAFTLITILIDGLVSDLRAPKVGGVLLLVLWMIPVYFAAQEVKWWHIVAILAAFLLLMLSPYLPATRWRGGMTAILAGALALAIGIGLPLLLPPVPTLPDRASKGQGDLTVTNPFLNLRQNLGDRDDKTLFSYQTTDEDADPIRLTSIDDFDGENWAPSPFSLDPFAIAADGMPWPAGMPRDKNFKEQTISVAVGDDYDQQYLPSPYAPQQPKDLSRRWIFDEKTLTVVGNGEKTGGLQYSMDYLSPNPDVEDLQSATPVSESDFETELAVPDSLPTSVKETAERVTADADNQWEAAVMLQAYFRGGDFEYSLDAPERASGDAISDFLADKQGYCVQFSSAMTIMARTMGIPARIGVGYAGGDESENGVDVSMQDSHAWPELYFEGAGWVRFEPTPGGPAGDPPKWTLADGADQQEEGDESESASPSEEPSESASPTGGSEEPTEEETSTQAAEPAGSNFGTVFGIAAIVLVLLLLAALPAIWRSILRSRRTKDPQNLEAVWTEVRALATDYGQSLDSSRTLRFNELVLAGAVPATGAAGGGGTEAADTSSTTGTDAGSTAPEIDPDTGEPLRKTAAEAVAGSGAAVQNAEAAGSSTFDRSDERLRRLSSPAPSRPSESGHDDSALGAFVDALEAQRYGAATEALDDSEVQALVDEVRTDLSERATPGSRISAKIWPASLFNRPK